MEQGLFAVGAACEKLEQLHDAMAYITNDSLLGRYVGQLGAGCVYKSLRRGFDSCVF